MDRSTRLVAVWSWLPAFRAVAETESVRGASQRLHVAASAISRTVRLLEDHLNAVLFTRRGRRLAITAAGTELLVAVRDAMRGVDDGLSLATSSEIGEVCIATPATLASTIVTPALARCVAREPTVVPRIVLTRRDPVRELLRGDIDLACMAQPVVHRSLQLVPLGELSSSVYCGPSHPLYRKRRISHADVLAHPFVAPPPGVEGVPSEGFPPHLQRRVGFWVELLQTGLELCQAGHALAVLPDKLASPTMRRLPFAPIPNIPIFVAMRRPVGRVGIIERIVAALADHLAMSGKPSTEVRRELGGSIAERPP